MRFSYQQSVWASLFFLALATSPVQAKSANKAKAAEPLLVTLSTLKIQVAADGKESFVKADKVKPGDVVQYTAVYHNRGKNSLSALKASLPIPLGMEYIGKSAQPSSVQASTDKIRYAQEPLMRTGKDGNGKESVVAVPYAEYQDLRWDIGTLAGGEKKQVSARMRVNQLPKSAADLVANPNAARIP